MTGLGICADFTTACQSTVKLGGTVLCDRAGQRLAGF